MHSQKSTFTHLPASASAFFYFYNTNTLPLPLDVVTMAIILQREYVPIPSSAPFRVVRWLIGRVVRYVSGESAFGELVLGLFFSLRVMCVF